MRIGYSAWGFLGPGVTDTPDGGRSWRRTALDALAADHEVLLMQANRDLTEAGLDLRAYYTWHNALPPLDALMLEWRWPLPGRNTTACATPGHTCDLHRQNQLLEHYTHGRGIRTLIWDLDEVLDGDDPLRTHPAVTVLEPALHPTPGAVTLTTPVCDRLIDHGDPARLVAGHRPWPLVYVGNQYRRDEMFDAFFAPAARSHRHRVAGKWPDTSRWPHVAFAGRVGFLDGQRLQREALSTVLLLPERYARAAHMTQRLPEAVLAGCLPIGPGLIRDIGAFVPPALIARDGEHAADLITALRGASPRARAHLLADCLARLEPFRASRFAAVVNRHVAHGGT